MPRQLEFQTYGIFAVSEYSRAAKAACDALSSKVRAAQHSEAARLEGDFSWICAFLGAPA
jgi:hypothetical protein